MENAVSAFYMAAATMIAMLVLSVFVYMFRIGGRLGETYELTQSTAQVIRFNGQFDAFAKKTDQLTLSDYGFSFITKGNTASDIITCANLALSINEACDYDPSTGLEIVVLCDGTKYSVFPAKSQPKSAFLIDKTLDAARAASDFPDSDTLKFYKFLKQYNEARTVDIVSTNYTAYGETIYKYYFDVDEDEDGNEGQGMSYGRASGKVNKIVFKMVTTQHYDDGTWPESE